MTLFDTIKKDHKEFLDIFDKLQATSARAVKSRDNLFMRLHRDIVAHMEAEEETIYPALMETDAREMALEAVEEHEAAKMILKDIDQTAYDEERWLPKLIVMKDMIEHHIEVEEGEVLPKAQSTFDAGTIKHMSKEFDHIRKSMMAEV